jgi:hypothetical protein
MRSMAPVVHTHNSGPVPTAERLVYRPTPSQFGSIFARRMSSAHLSWSVRTNAAASLGPW